MSENYFKDGDSLICFNFRPDRARQIIKSLAEENFTDFERKTFPKLDLITLAHLNMSLPIIYGQLYSSENLWDFM